VGEIGKHWQWISCVSEVNRKEAERYVRQIKQKAETISADIL